MTKYDNEDDIFRDAVRGVKPLNFSKISMTPPKPVIRVKKTVTVNERPDFHFSDYEKLDPLDSNETVFYHQPGIQHKILRKLRQGQYNAQATLDLHGQTVAEAKESLQNFLIYCQCIRARHALIIHGKGRSGTKPILKNRLNHWLRETKRVLAFCSATLRDGQAGALYVLLKIHNEEI